MGVIDSMLLTKHDNGDRKFKLATALRHYTGQAIENAHNAEGDVVATMRVLQAALRRWVCCGGHVSASAMRCVVASTINRGCCSQQGL